MRQAGHKPGHNGQAAFFESAQAGAFGGLVMRTNNLRTPKKQNPTRRQGGKS